MISVEGEVVLEGVYSIERMRNAAQFFIDQANVTLVEESENITENILAECNEILRKFNLGEFAPGIQGHELRYELDEIYSMFAETIVHFAAEQHPDDALKKDLKDMLTTLNSSRELDMEY